MKIEESIFYDEDAEYNKMFLRSTENHLNSLLKIRGYLYKNQIYEFLGIRWNPSWENTLYLPSDEIEVKNFIE